jgi:hypothetical protein
MEHGKVKGASSIVRSAAKAAERLTSRIGE